MADDVAIRVKGVSKNFLLPHEKNTTIKSAFLGLARKKHASSNEVQHALKDISFEVKKGEFFGIVGRNGSGKSTLLKMLAGIYQPTKGSVAVGGKVVPFIELGVGFNPELSGRDNVYLNGALLGFSQAEVGKMYDEIVEFAELEKFMDQKLKNYSSGMQVRLAFSMAVRAEADILLVDEVLAVGDSDFQRKCFDYFKLLKKNKKTVVFVSHDMSAVREYCDRAILIEKSELIQSGKADKIAGAYTKMFIRKDNEGTSQLSDNRWGDQSMIFSDLKLSDTTLTDSESELVVTVKVTAKQDVEHPILGFSITAPNGTKVLGTNNNLKRLEMSDIKKGEPIVMKLKIPNIFSEGTHYLNLAAVYANGTGTADWWDEAAQFKVIRQENNPYVVLPEINMSFSGGRN
jgi:ABC-2 type transport system ATP-binding protein